MSKTTIRQVMDNTTIQNMSKTTNQTPSNFDTIKAGTKVDIVYQVITDHSHEYRDRILPQPVFPVLGMYYWPSTTGT